MKPMSEHSEAEKSVKSIFFGSLHYSPPYASIETSIQITKETVSYALTEGGAY